jgi:hypothetical protein
MLSKLRRVKPIETNKNDGHRWPQETGIRAPANSKIGNKEIATRASREQTKQITLPQSTIAKSN